MFAPSPTYARTRPIRLPPAVPFRACRPSPSAFCTPRRGRRPDRWNGRSSRRAAPSRSATGAGSSPLAQPTCGSSPALRMASRSAPACAPSPPSPSTAGRAAWSCSVRVRCRWRPPGIGARSSRVAGGRGRAALANNVYSADVVALGGPTVERDLRDLPDLPADNALPRWLAEVGGWAVAGLERWRLGIDLDSPLDVVLVGRAADMARLHRADVPLEAVIARLAGVAAILADRRAELVVAGRTSAGTLRALERRAACRVRALDRGARPAGGEPPRPRRCRPGWAGCEAAAIDPGTAGRSRRAGGARRPPRRAGRCRGRRHPRPDRPPVRPGRGGLAAGRGSIRRRPPPARPDRRPVAARPDRRPPRRTHPGPRRRPHPCRAGNPAPRHPIVVSTAAEEAIRAEIRSRRADPVRALHGARPRRSRGWLLHGAAGTSDSRRRLPDRARASSDLRGSARAAARGGLGTAGPARSVHARRIRCRRGDARPRDPRRPPGRPLAAGRGPGLRPDRAERPPAGRACRAGRIGGPARRRGAGRSRAGRGIRAEHRTRARRGTRGRRRSRAGQRVPRRAPGARGRDPLRAGGRGPRRPDRRAARSRSSSCRRPRRRSGPGSTPWPQLASRSERGSVRSCAWRSTAGPRRSLACSRPASSW